MSVLGRWRLIGGGEFQRWEQEGEALEGRWVGQHDGQFGPLGSLDTAIAATWTAQPQNAELTALSFDERFALLVDAEWRARKNKRLDRALREAKLKLPHARIESLCARSTGRPPPLGCSSAGTPASGLRSLSELTAPPGQTRDMGRHAGWVEASASTCWRLNAESPQWRLRRWR